MEFANPPVAETSLGFYFQKIEGWNVLHQGALWERFRSRYSEYEFLPPIMEIPSQPNAGLDLASIPIRVGFTDNTKTQLVQMQDGFLLHNWRKTPEIREYPRYEAVNPELQQDWSTFRAYLHERSLKGPVVTRCQMDYFNHLVRGEEWQDFSDLSNLFTVWNGFRQPTAGDGELQMVSFSFSYRLKSGTVNVVVQPAIRKSDGKEIIQFTLSSSMAPKSSEDKALFACLDECHDNAAVAFLDFTTAQARERWKQK